MRLHHFHFDHNCYSRNILRNKGFEPEQIDAVRDFVARNKLKRILVWGPGKAGRYARAALGASFVAYVGRDTKDFSRLGRVDAVLIGASPSHYASIIACCEELFKGEETWALCLFEEPPAEEQRDTPPSQGHAAFAAMALACLAAWGAAQLAARAWNLPVVEEALAGPAAWLGGTVLAAEILVRVISVFFTPALALALARLRVWTFPGKRAVEGHPFLQHVGNPRQSLIGNVSLGNLTPFNNLGFSGEDMYAPKPPDTLRIAFLGGSTTLDGYPALVEKHLNGRFGDRIRFEALNFGMGGFCSAHSLTNLLLNGLDLEPDCIVIHEGWNDVVCRNFPPERFRGDYLHSLKAFSPPPIPLRALLRNSLLYRLASHLIAPNPAWQRLGPATLRPHPYRGGSMHENLAELAPFRRNLGLMVDIARSRGIAVLLTTQPRREKLRDPQEHYFAGHMDQTNGVVRDLHKQYGDSIAFLDLARAMGESLDHVYTDVGHMTPQGIAVKAELVAESLQPILEPRMRQMRGQEPCGLR